MHKPTSHIFLKFVLFLLIFFPHYAIAENNPVDEKPIWLVVTRPIFIETIKPLQQKRSKEGFETIISTQPVSETIAGLKRKPAFILLVGDDQPGQENQSWYLASKKRELYRWQISQEKNFASDALFGDINGDLIPDIPVGRIPARTPEQLKLVIDKIIDFESRQPTPDDLRMPIWAGSAGYNQMLDNMTTLMLLAAIEKYAAPWTRAWIISSDTNHSLCGWPPDQPKMFTNQLKQVNGPMIIMMGHGSTMYFSAMWSVFTDIKFDAAAAENALAAGKPAAPMVIIACSTGNFTSEKNCLTESLLFLPAGPVAAIGATTASHPLTNYFSGLSLIQQQNPNEKRLGSIWLKAQLNAMKARDLIMEPVLINIEGKLEDKLNANALRRDQILMYALLGDPATKLHLPDRLQVDIKYLQNSWQWEAQKPKDASKLFVGLRAAGQTLPLVSGNPDKTTAQRLFEQANATFEFTPIVELNANEEWKGKINKEGTLRLVAIGKNSFYVAAFDLKAPAENQLTEQNN